jgi:IS605 OrfB family transposase
MIIRSHRIHLNPTPEQHAYFAHACDTRRFVYNWGLAEWQRQYAAGGEPSALDLKKQFNAIHREQFPWTYEVTKCAVEGAFMDLATAFKNFFDGRKEGKSVGYPRYKATTAIADKYQFVAIEDLNMRGMMKNHALAQSLGDASLSRFTKLLEQKVTKRGGSVQKVGRFYPSSKTCSGCGVVRETLLLGERTFVCPVCGMELDRDYNAAVNILSEGQRLRAGNRKTQPHRPVVATTDVNACGQTVRPSAYGQAARLDEAGTP